MKRWSVLGKRISRSAPYGLPGLTIMLLAWTYFAGVKYLPQQTGDESSLLDIPYRFCQFHDFRYPATWSQSFGSEQVRKYPPISAFLLRNIYHGVVGFSALSSRIFSGLLILSVLFSTFLLLRRFVYRPGASWFFFFLCQLGLTPVLIYNARTTRFEQEVFFLGAWGCIALPCLMSSITSRWGQGVCWILIGVSLALAATSHPFGVVFPLVGGCWYFLCMRRQGGLDRLTGWRRLGFLGTGLVLGLLPTALWLASDPVNTVRFTRALSAIYAARKPDMVAYLAALPPWHWLTRFVPLQWAARLNALDTAAYLEHAGYPVAHYRFKLLMHSWFYVQLTVVIGYFLYSLRRRFRNDTAWTHLPVWLAIGFVSCMVLYTPPNTTYNLYPAFFVSLAFIVIVWSLWCERWRLSAIWRAAVVAAFGCAIGSSLLFAHYGVVHAVQLAQRLARHGKPVICLDQELLALRNMASRLGLDRPNARVYTSTESWIAAGRDNRALLESVVLGQDTDWSKVDGVVFSNLNLQFFINRFCQNISPPFPNPAERVTRLRSLLGGLRLSGLVLNQLNPSAAFLFYTPARFHDDVLNVATMARRGHTEATIARLVHLPESRSADGCRQLPAGRYLLLAWAQPESNGQQIHVHVWRNGAKTDSSGDGGTVSLQAANTVFPAVLRFEILADGGMVSFDMPPRHLSTACGRVELYRLASD